MKLILFITEMDMNSNIHLSNPGLYLCETLFSVICLCQHKSISKHKEIHPTFSWKVCASTSPWLSSLCFRFLF